MKSITLEYKFSDVMGPDCYEELRLSVPGWVWEEFQNKCNTEGSAPALILPVLMRRYIDREISKITRSEVDLLCRSMIDRWEKHTTAIGSSTTEEQIFSWHMQSMLLPNILVVNFKSMICNQRFYPNHVLALLMSRYCDLKIDRVSPDLALQYFEMNQDIDDVVSTMFDNAEWWFYLEDASALTGVDYGMPDFRTDVRWKDTSA